MLTANLFRQNRVKQGHFFPLFFGKNLPPFFDGVFGVARLDFSKEFHCGFCGYSCRHGEEKFITYLGVKLAVPPRRDGNAGCPQCGRSLRYKPRTKKKAN